MLLNCNCGGVICRNSKEFDADFICVRMPGKEQRKADRKEDRSREIGLNQFDFNTLVFTSDGGFFLLAEQVYMITHAVATTNPQCGLSCQPIPV